MIGAVADTYAVIWYLLDSQRLSDRAAAEFERCQTSALLIGVSSMTIIEIIYLIEKNRIPETTLGLLKERLQQAGAPLEIIPITHDIASGVQLVPRDQVSDLPDRVIAATAVRLGVPLISRDGKIRVSDVDTIW
jgi:PIN domain nuclease of toxin-antitoxin system